MSRFINKILKLPASPGFWLITVLLLIITVLHYTETIQYPSFLNTIIAGLDLDRFAFERILYLAPIIWACFIFGFRGSLISSLFALIVMLSRAMTISESRLDAFFESFAVVIVGDMLALTIDALRHSRQRRLELEAIQHELQLSEQRYRSLFEDAHDAIWLQDMDGNITDSNAANKALTGYDVQEIVGMNVRQFLSSEALDTAKEIRRLLIEQKSPGETYDQKIKRKDGGEATIRLSSSVIRRNGKPVGFQHIARDITEEQRQKENQRLYLEQITRAQELERKRISRELHDDTIQSLVVLSRQLDALASSKTDVPETVRRRLEELWQQSNNIMQGVRRLSQDLRPAALDRLGLLPAIQMLAEDTTQYSNIPVNVRVLGIERRFGEEVELVLFRIVQEALRNIWRHSEATKAEVTVEFTNYKVKITISDNGKGFDLPPTVGDFTKDGKLGLAGMEERARLVGATLTAESQAGKGTIIAIELAA
jgi:PAS domain S-box-containing protein